jgi:GNAT superfamily N-acetyltransferase
VVWRRAGIDRDPGGLVTSQVSTFQTRELSTDTWSDFERLFSQGGGWDHCQCMHFHRPHALPKAKHLPTRAERCVRNREEKKALVDRGRAHGILVYVAGEPVGWCQYGPREELPRIDSSRKYQSIVVDDGETPLWRITCFVVHKGNRRRGVATAALAAALEAIKTRGGGLVEAFPLATLTRGSFGNMSTHGTVSMFRKHGFEVVAPFGGTNVLMRRVV